MNEFLGLLLIAIAFFFFIVFLLLLGGGKGIQNERKAFCTWHFERYADVDKCLENPPYLKTEFSQPNKND